MSTGLVFLLDTHGQILIKLLPGLVIAALGLGPTLVAATTSGLTGIPEVGFRHAFLTAALAALVLAPATLVLLPHRLPEVADAERAAFMH